MICGTEIELGSEMVTRREKEMDKDVKNRRGRRVATSDRERDERSEELIRDEMRMKRGNTNGDGQRETNGDRHRDRDGHADGEMENF